MPHITIQYTANIKEAGKISELFLPIHRLIVETLDADINNCKTKATEINEYLYADGGKGFVMIELVLKKGRDEKVINNAALEIIKMVKEFFSESIAKDAIGISFEIRDLSDLYYKI